MVKDEIEELKSKKNIHIVGAAGIEGAAIAIFLFSRGIKNVILHDFSHEAEFEASFKNARDYLSPKKAQELYERLINCGYKIYYQKDYLKDIEKADLIFISQGWFRYESNQKLKSLKGKISFSSVTELYFQLAPCPIIGVTGTVGKSTTARLIYEMLKTCGKKAYLSGNDRDNPPVLDKLLKLSKDSYLVLEVSNRQLIDLKYSPHIAIVTNIFPNHPDDHKNFAEYIKVKSNIVRYQTKKDFAVLNADNKESRRLKNLTPAKTYFFSLKEGQRDKNLKEARLSGEHNRANIMAAVITGRILRLDRAKMVKALVNFKGLKHRLEFITKKKGISFYEDSQSTNPYSTASAIEAFSKQQTANSKQLTAGNLILIMGGYRANAKESDYSEPVSKFFMPHLKAVVLIGRVAPIIQNEYFRQKRTRAHGPDFIKNCETLAKAMREIKNLAENGDVVVLSPGAESFGEFRDYRHRGEVFKKLVDKF